MSSSKSSYEFNSAISVKVHNQTKQAKATLHFDKNNIYASNWKIAIKQACIPIIDEEQQVVLFKDKKRSKEFLCNYGPKISSRLQRSRNRSTRGSAMNQQSYSPKAPPSKALRDFLNRIESRIAKYQEKHASKNSTPELSADDTNVDVSRQPPRNRRANLFGSQNWTSKKHSKGANRTYGRKSKKERKILRMLHKYDEDNSDEELEKPEEVKKDVDMDIDVKNQDEEESLSAATNTNPEQNSVSHDSSVMHEDMSTLESDEEQDHSTYASNHIDTIAEIIKPKRQLRKSTETSSPPINKKRRLRHNRAVDSIESDDDEFDAPLLMLESESPMYEAEKKRKLASSLDVEPSNLSMEDVASVTVTDEENNTENEKYETISQHNPIVHNTNTKIEAKVAVISTKKKAANISNFFQRKKSNSKASINKEIDVEDTTKTIEGHKTNQKVSIHTQERFMTETITNEDKQMDPPVLAVISSPANEEINEKSDSNGTISKSKSTPPSLSCDATNNSPPAKRNLTAYFSRSVTPSTPISQKPVVTAQTTSVVKNPYNSPRTKLPSGLTNLGNTCYINSSLQLLFSLPDFFQSLFKFPVGRDFEKDPAPPKFNLYSTLTNLFKKTGNRISKGKVQSASQLKKCIDGLSKRFLGFEQRDSHEFLSDLIDLLHEEMHDKRSKSKSIKNTALESEEKVSKAGSSNIIDKREEEHNETEILPTDGYFCMKVKVCLTCDSCNYSRCKEEMYRHLSLDVDTTKNDDKTTLEEGLKHFFAHEKRELACEKCEGGKIATQTMEILQRPKALLLHLKRFIILPPNNNSGNQVAFRKNRIAVEFPSHIELNSNDGDLCKKSEENEYRLKSLVHHIGTTAYSGHYMTDAFRDGKWIRFDDGVVKEMRDDDVLNSTDVKRNVYMLLYELKE